jgi:3-oxoadipate enol-lactonase
VRPGGARGARTRAPTGLSFNGVQCQVCKLNDGHVAFETRGEGIPLVFIHGFSFDMRTWDAQVEVLSRYFQVVRYDLRGFGRSSVPTGPYSHVEDLRALIEFLSLSAPVLIGLSLGANIALSCALDHPHAVQGLILASSGLPGFAWSEPRPPDAAAAVAKSQGVEHARQFWLNHPLFAAARRSPTAFARVRSMIEEYSGWHWCNVNPAAQAGVIDRLSECVVPTLVLSGDLDVLGYRQIAAKLRHDIPGAALQTFHDAGHIINEEDPAGFSAAVLEFVRKIAVPVST